MANDDRADWRQAWALFPGAVAYVWHGGLRAGEVEGGLTAAGFRIRAQIIWVKPSLIVSRGHYHYRHEPCYYAVREKQAASWRGDRKQSTVWEVAHGGGGGDAANGEHTAHSTQKPVELWLRPLANHTVPGEGVYDPFLGSGTAVIAAEQVGRVAYGLELEPAYVDIIVKRWELFTGGKATVVRADEEAPGG